MLNRKEIHPVICPFLKTLFKNAGSLAFLYTMYFPGQVLAQGSPPIISILNPIDGSPYVTGSVVGVAASASDSEDGDLSRLVQWSSDIDGGLGQGSVKAFYLSNGIHTITATVFDSDSLTATSSVQIDVNSAGCTAPDNTYLVGTNTGVFSSSNPDISYRAFKMSGDGRYVLFYQLDQGGDDSNGAPDLYLWDRDENTVDWVSPNDIGVAASPGPYGWGTAQHFSLSDDGNLITFNAYSSDMVANDTNEVSDVFIHNRQTGATSRISVNNSGSQLNSQYGWGSTANTISGDGTKVAFMTDGRIAAADQTDFLDIYVRDIATGEAVLATLNSNGNPIINWDNLDSQQQLSCSQDCSVVAFVAKQAMVPDDNNGVYDIYIRDFNSNTTERITAFPSGVTINAGALTPVVSADGNFIVYKTPIDNIALGDDNGQSDIYLYDRSLNETVLVSVNSSSEVGNGASFKPSVSADGRFVAFESVADNLDDRLTDNNEQADVFVRDRQAGITYRVSIDDNGEEGVEASGYAAAFNPFIYADGSSVAYRTTIDITDNNGYFWNFYSSKRPICSPANQAPVAWIAAPSAPQTILESQTITFNGIF